MARIVVVYYSGTGNTKMMAEAVAEGAKFEGAHVTLKTADETTANHLIAADGFAFGSPAHFHYMAGKLKTVFDNCWISRKMIGTKPYVAFASGAYGGTHCLASIEDICNDFQFVKAANGIAVAGAPSDKHLQSLRELGAALARAAAK